MLLDRRQRSLDARVSIGMATASRFDARLSESWRHEDDSGEVAAPDFYFDWLDDVGERNSTTSDGDLKRNIAQASIELSGYITGRGARTEVETPPPSSYQQTSPRSSASSSRHLALTDASTANSSLLPTPPPTASHYLARSTSGLSNAEAGPSRPLRTPGHRTFGRIVSAPMSGVRGPDASLHSLVSL